MEALVFQSTTGKDVTTSLTVAKVFGKRHDHVLRDIQGLTCSPEFRLPNFGEIKYLDDKGREYPAFEMTKNGFSFLVMGYTGEKASQFKEQFIAEFDKRTELLTNDDYIIHQALSILDKKAKALEGQLSFKTQQLELATQTIQEQAPMVKIFQEVISADNAHLATAMAQMFDISARKFNALLKGWKVQRTVGKEWTLCAKYQGNGYTLLHPVPYPDKDGNIKTKNELRWTEKGRLFLIEFFAAKGYKTVNAAA